MIQFLIDHRNRSLHQNPWLFPRLPFEPPQGLRQPFPPLLFENRVLAGRQFSQMPDHILPRRQPIPPDRVAHQRPQNLLGPPPADPEDKLERRPVHPGQGKGLELPDGFFQTVIPDGLVRHSASIPQTEAIMRTSVI